jgi:hypothetical protein
MAENGGGETDSGKGAKGPQDSPAVVIDDAGASKTVQPVDVGDVQLSESAPAGSPSEGASGASLANPADAADDSRSGVILESRKMTTEIFLVMRNSVG